MEKTKSRRMKSKCQTCGKWFTFPNLMAHKCPVLHSLPPAFKSTLHSKEDLQCCFCGLQTENPKLLEIHMRSCIYRNVPQICKLCREPIRLRGHDKQYCDNCSTFKGRNLEYGLRFKAATLTQNLSSKSSRPYTVPAKNTENGNFSIVNCINAESSLISARQKMVPMSDSQKQGKRTLKIKFADHQIKKKQPKITNPKIASDKEANTEKQIQVGMKQLREVHHISDKLSKSSAKNAVQPKKNFKSTIAEVVTENFKNNNSQKLNLKTSRQMDQKTRQKPKKNDLLLCKNNLTNKKVTIQLLLDTIPENDCGMLLHSSSANKMDHYYKCCRCGKAFRSIKLGSTHLSNCKSNKLLSTEVSASDVKWVCTICHSFFVSSILLGNHLKGCNILKKKYDRACERRCEKCNFRCLSSLKFEEHDCTKELKSMKTCAVRLNVVKMNSSFGRVVMRECEFCSEIFDEQLTEQHFQSHHPGEPMSGNFKQYYVNLNPVTSSDTVVVKTEPVSPVHEFFGNSSYNFPEPHHYPLVNNNPVPDNISMPPPPPLSLPIVQSTVSLPIHQSPSTLGMPSSSQPASDGARAINEQICRCADRTVGNDAKPCLRCLSKVDITRFSQNFNVVPYRLAKIKKETLNDSEISNSNRQADSIAAASLTEIESGMVEIDGGRNLFPFQLFDAFQPYPSLTPPSSHNGISPPSTPLVQPLTNGEPCTASDVSIGSLNEAISMVPDISQLDEPRCPDELVHYINDDSSPDIPLEQCDDQELFIPIDSCRMTPEWNDTYGELEHIDVFAIVPSEGNETVEKYVCSQCINFSCLDRNVIIKHFYKNHEKKLHFSCMYVIKTENDSQ